MSIIYSYPTKASPVDNDLLVISDSADKNRTKQITVSSLKTLTAGVTSIVAGNNITIDPLSGIGDVTINASGSVTSVTSANEAITVDNSTTAPVLTSRAYTGGTGIGHVPTGSNGSATVYLDGSGNWSTPASGGSDLVIEDENNVVADAATTINFTGGGVTASGDNTQVDVEVLPRLNHGWSPISISQGGSPITIAGGSSLAFAVQGICDIAAGQLTVARIFGNLPRGCRVNVAVYTGSLTFQGSTALVYFGSLKNQNGVPGVSSTNTDDNSFINNIFYIDEPVGTGNNWVPVAGTPIITIIEIDNSNGVDGQGNPEEANILGQTNGSAITTTFLKTLAFAVAPPQNQTSIFTNTNTELGKQVNTVLNFGSAQPTPNRICQHFDPDK